MTVPERSLEPEVAEAWIRDLLARDARGVELTVSGTCMEPALPEGSKVILRTTGPVRLGDIVLLRIAAGLRLHRVVLVSARALRTKGDQGIYLDPPAPRQAVIAVCDTAEPRPIRLARVVGSLLRWLAFRLRSRTSSRELGDQAHARLLP